MSQTLQLPGQPIPDSTAPRPDNSPAGYTLMDHQKVISDLMVIQPFLAVWMGIGAGKTLATLDALRKIRPADHILVIAPIAIARSTWLDEIKDKGFRIRTRSLLVDEQDRKLSPQARLERFKDVFTDPPTMYFINHELLTQPSRPPKLLVPAAPTPGTAQLSAQAATALGLLQQHGPMPKDQLIAHLMDPAVLSTPLKKTAAATAIKQLTDTGSAVRQEQECPACGGAGCRQCSAGLIDQLPTFKAADGKQYMSWPFPTVIIDEAQVFKSPDSQRFKALASVRGDITRLIELTGTPTPNGLHDLWSQIYLLDQGTALGKNITAYRDRWLTPKMVYGTNVPARWLPNKGAEEEIYAAIGDLAISTATLKLNLPPVTVNDVHITLPAHVIQAYERFKAKLLIDIATPYADEHGVIQQAMTRIIAKNQNVLRIKLLQFASGTLYTGKDDPADPDRKAGNRDYEVIHEDKLDMLEYLIEQNNNQPVLLIYNFIADLKQIMARMKASRIKAVKFDGSREMKRQWNNRQFPVMALHPASAGHGLNLQQGGSTVAWYTLTENLEWYMQANGRLARTGQTEPVMIHRLISRGTIDEAMPHVLIKKAKEQKDLMLSVDITTIPINASGTADPLSDEEALIREFGDISTASNIHDLS